MVKARARVRAAYRGWLKQRVAVGICGSLGVLHIHPYSISTMHGSLSVLHTHPCSMWLTCGSLSVLHTHPYSMGIRALLAVEVELNITCGSLSVLHRG